MVMDNSASLLVLDIPVLVFSQELTLFHANPMAVQRFSPRVGETFQELFGLAAEKVVRTMPRDGVLVQRFTLRGASRLLENLCLVCVITP